MNEQYSGRSSALVPIYGRRRVGKSELIRRFIQDRPAVYHVGRTTPTGELVRDFLGQVARVLDDPVLAELPVEGWRRPLELLSRFRSRGKLIVVFDEFQWTALASPGLTGLLQELWDTQWRDSGRLFLVLCGSYVGFMERKVLGRRAPLFGRRTGQILLQPLTHSVAAALHPRWSLRHRAEAHFLCGGIPAYLRCFDDAQSVEVNIQQVILRELGPLRREADFLLREELRQVERYYAVLLAVASGSHTSQQIAERIGLGARGGISYYLRQLEALGYVARRQPVSDARPKRTQVRYMLEDPLLRFWFRYVFPNESSLERLGPEQTFRQHIRPGLDAYYGTCFERLCRAALGDIYAREGVTARWQIGEYWSKDVQIDVVGVRDDYITDLGECKWGTVRSPAGVESELRATAARFPNARGATIALRVFARTKPRLPRAGVSWHDLEDLYR